MMLRFALVLGLIVSVGIVTSSPTRAANPDYEIWTSSAAATRKGSAASDLHFNFAGGFAFAPDYLGSDDYTIQTLPLLSVEWRGIYFLSTQQGLGMNLIRHRNTRAGPRLTSSAGRKASKNTNLNGMSDLASSTEFGGFFEHFRGAWRYDGDIRYGLNSSGHHGIIASGGVAVAGRLSERSNLILGGRFHWANTDYMAANFGVKASEVGDNLSVYSPAAGFRDFGGHASIIYNVNDQVYFTIDGRADFLMSNVVDSPLVKSDQQFFFGAMVGIRF